MLLFLPSDDSLGWFCGKIQNGPQNTNFVVQMTNIVIITSSKIIFNKYFSPLSQHLSFVYWYHLHT